MPAKAPSLFGTADSTWAEKHYDACLPLDQDGDHWLRLLAEDEIHLLRVSGFERTVLRLYDRSFTHIGLLYGNTRTMVSMRAYSDDRPRGPDDDPHHGRGSLR